MRPVRTLRRIRLNPAHPPLWRSESTVQFGVDRRAEVDLTEPWQQQLLQQLWEGIRPDALDVIAHGLAAPRDEVHAFMAALAPVLQSRRLHNPVVWLSTDDPGDAAARAWVAEVLRRAEVLVSGEPTPGAIEVRLVHGLATTRAFAAALSADESFLPIAFDPGGVSIGPLVVPGRTPCLSCRDLALRDADAAWPMVHAQLAGLRLARLPTPRAIAAASLAAELLHAADAGGVWLYLSAEGSVTRHPVAFHAECLCHAGSVQSRLKTATARARPGRLPATG